MRGIRVTETEFLKVKKLAKKGVSYSMIADLLKREAGTISLMAKCVNFDEYKEVMRLRNSEKRTKTEKPVTKSALTREEVENFIQAKISEIRDVCLRYNPRCHHVSMYYIGVSQNVHCFDDKTGEILLQNHNGLFDSMEGDEA